MSRARAAESSLELLLDTICNTFGGVIFLAILVVVLVQMTSRSEVTDSPAPSQAELAALEERRSDNQAKLEAKRQAAAQQAKLIEQLAKPENRDLLNQLQRMRSSRQKVTDDRSRSLGHVSQAQMKVNEITEALKQTSRAIRDATNALAAAEQALQKEMASRTRTAHHSVLHSTEKRGTVLLLRYGRLYQHRRRGQASYVLNAADCEERLEGGLTAIVPKPGGGKPIKGIAAATLAKVLADYDATEHYLLVLVWPDSFTEFAPLRDAMVNSGFEYDLQPLPKGATARIREVSGPGEVPHVQ